MDTEEEKMTMRLMSPLNNFEKSGVRTGYWNTVGWNLRELDGRFQNTKGTVDSRTNEFYL